MNRLGNSVNTRLESRNDFDKLRNQFIQNRTAQNQQIIKPINQDDFVNFHQFKDKYENYKTPENVNKKFEQYQKDRQLNIEEFIAQTPEKVKLEKQKEIIAKQNALIEKEREKAKIQRQNMQKLLEEQRLKESMEKKKVQQQKLMETQRQEIARQKEIIKNLQNDNQQKYVPEIGKKRKLKNVLKDVFSKHNMIVENQVIEKYLNRYNINSSNVSSKNLMQIIFEIKNEINKPKITDVEFETDTIETEQLVSINSSDRDLKLWKYPNEFRIDFAPNDVDSSKKGYINRSFDNVVSVQLVSAIFPKSELIGSDNIEDYPYINLEVEELGSSYEGTNDNSSKAFAQISFDLDLGKFKKLVCRNNIEYKKTFNPRLSLSRFTIRIKKPNGELFNFGDIPEKVVKKPMNIDTDQFVYNPEINLENDNAVQEGILETYPPITMVFKIISIKRRLDNMFLNRRDS